MAEKEATEANLSSPSSQVPATMTLQKAIDLGEYDPAFLSQFPEWQTLSRYIQFQYIRQAIVNRNQRLLTQWAELNNVLDFRLKPHLKDALQNIEKQLNKLQAEKERLFVEYSEYTVAQDPDDSQR